MAKSGMEMLVESVLKAAGFNPKEIFENVEQTVASFKNAADKLQQSQNEIHGQLAVINARLERIERHLEIASDDGQGSAVVPRRIAG